MKSTPKDTVLTLRVNRALLDKFDAICRGDHRKRPDRIRQLIQRDVEHGGDKIIQTPSDRKR